MAINHAQQQNQMIQTISLLTSVLVSIKLNRTLVQFFQNLICSGRKGSSLHLHQYSMLPNPK